MRVQFNSRIQHYENSTSQSHPHRQVSRNRQTIAPPPRSISMIVQTLYLHPNCLPSRFTKLSLAAATIACPNDQSYLSRYISKQQCTYNTMEKASSVLRVFIVSSLIVSLNCYDLVFQNKCALWSSVVVSAVLVISKFRVLVIILICGLVFKLKWFPERQFCVG